MAEIPTIAKTGEEIFTDAYEQLCVEHKRKIIGIPKFIASDNGYKISIVLTTVETKEG